MSISFKYTRLSKNDAACLLVDHQSGLISLAGPRRGRSFLFSKGPIEK